MINGDIEPTSASGEPTREVKIQTTVSIRVNLADYQNAVPAVHELAVVNETESTFRNLRLTALSEPSFLKSKTWHLDHLAAGQTIRVSDLDIALDGPLLGRLTEAEKAVLKFELTTNDDASAIVTLPRFHVQ